MIAFATPLTIRPALNNGSTLRQSCCVRQSRIFAYRRPATSIRMALLTELMVKAIEASAISLIGGTITPDITIPPINTVPLELPKDVQTLCRSFENFLKRIPSSTTPENNDKYVKLVICIAVDLIGSGSLAVPLVGDALDLFCAPLIALVLQALYGSSFITLGGFTEELLPGTDAIPTATLAWIAEQMGYLEEWGWIPSKKVTKRYEHQGPRRGLRIFRRSR